MDQIQENYGSAISDRSDSEDEQRTVSRKRKAYSTEWKLTVIKHAKQIWMDDELTADYLDKTLGRSLFEKRLLVWDSFRCHLSVSTKKKLKETGIHSAVVPGGCTKFIQAPDVVWNGPFKAKIRELYNIWMLNDASKEFTAGGNPKAPSMNVYLEWVCQAWEDLPKEMIAQSFKVCGITNSHHDSEDNLIHCFKETGPVPEGFQMLQDSRFFAEDLPPIEVAD